MPRFIEALLSSSVFYFLARLLLIVTFIIPGVLQIVQFKSAIGDFTYFHLSPPAPFVIASAITLLAGSVLVLFGGKWTWLGAGALGVYTGLTIFIAHHFWNMTGQDAVNEMRTALEHISIIGGLMVAAILSSRPLLRGR